MKEVCLCIYEGHVYSVGIWDELNEGYYSAEFGGRIDLTKKNLFEFKEISFFEFRQMLTKSLNK